MDLASAHYKALEYLRKENDSDIFNLGNGNGYSVKEVIETTRKVTGHSIPAEVKERRAGDPATLIASSEKAKSVLGWKPEFDSLKKIIEDAWRWHESNPDEYLNLNCVKFIPLESLLLATDLLGFVASGGKRSFFFTCSSHLLI